MTRRQGNRSTSNASKLSTAGRQRSPRMRSPTRYLVTPLRTGLRRSAPLRPARHRLPRPGATRLRRRTLAPVKLHYSSRQSSQSPVRRCWELLLQIGGSSIPRLGDTSPGKNGSSRRRGPSVKPSSSLELGTIVLRCWDPWSRYDQCRRLHYSPSRRFLSSSCTSCSIGAAAAACSAAVARPDRTKRPALIFRASAAAPATFPTLSPT